MNKKNTLYAFITAALLAAVLLLSIGFKEPASGSFSPVFFSFSGGSGRVSISCNEVILDKGKSEALIVFSSPNYSYVKVDDRLYEGSYTEKSSSFLIPAVLDSEFTIIGCTTAMSTPHEIEYSLYISLNEEAPGHLSGDQKASDKENKEGQEESEELKDGVRAKAALGFSDSDAPKIPGYTFKKRLELKFARYFDVFYYDKGVKVVGVADRSYYLCIPEGEELPKDLPENLTVIKAPRNIYVAATGAMSLFDALGSVDRIGFSGTDEGGWFIDAPKKAMENGSMEYAGKYNAPDYELLLNKGCDLAVESTMILHSPETKEQLKNLGIPVFTDYSSYERTAAGKSEWIYAYGAILDREEEAEKAFAEITDALDSYKSIAGSGKKVALFYINNGGLAVIRSDEDYITDLILQGGGENAFSEAADNPGDSTAITLPMESFYDLASDADYIIYNSTIDGSVSSLKDLLSKSELFKDFKAVKNGNVFLLGKEFYQSTDRLYLLAGDINKMLNAGTDDMVFLRRIS